MLRPWVDCCLLGCLFAASALTSPLIATAQASETSPDQTQTYRIHVAVNEVTLTFHAADEHGLPVTDLKINELNLLDDGKPPSRVLEFGPVQSSAVRGGILIDTSESVQQQVSGSRAISSRFAQRMLRQPADQGFVMAFGYTSRITQPWTSDATALTAGIRQVVTGRENPLGGTALFDTLFRACFNLFGNVDHASGGNFILLFSDGNDNASHTSMPEVIDICQRANTAIYAFRAEPSASLFSGGPKTLAELAAQTGGRVFPDDDTEAATDDDLRTIEGDQRNQYRLIYSPAELKHDGQFHRIVLQLPTRVDSVSVRSGYYDRPR